MLAVFDHPEAGGHGCHLHAFAWRYADTVMRPDMLSLARLIIGEVQRFPEIGRAYQAAGPDQLLRGIMRYLESQRATGRLRFDDAELAAAGPLGPDPVGPADAGAVHARLAPDRADAGALCHERPAGLSEGLFHRAKAPILTNWPPFRPPQQVNHDA
jgi:TetR/AcrR family transcriptional repressor of mexJK operon